MIKAIVFDLDGTLTEFNLDYKGVRSEAIQFFASRGFDSSMFTLNESVFEMLEIAEVYVRQHNEGGRKSEGIRRDIFLLADRYEILAARTTRLLPSANMLLEAAKRMRLKRALYTTKGKKATDYILKHFHINRFFDIVITREDVSAIKPNVAHLETVLEALDTKPEEAIIVGDSTEDVLCGRQLNTITIAVTTGVSSLSELVDSGAKYVFPSLNDVIPAMKRILRQG